MKLPPEIATGRCLRVYHDPRGGGWYNLYATMEGSPVGPFKSPADAKAAFAAWLTPDRRADLLVSLGIEEVEDA